VSLLVIIAGSRVGDEVDIEPNPNIRIILTEHFLLFIRKTEKKPFLNI